MKNRTLYRDALKADSGLHRHGPVDVRATLLSRVNPGDDVSFYAHGKLVSGVVEGRTAHRSGDISIHVANQWFKLSGNTRVAISVPVTPRQ